MWGGTLRDSGAPAAGYMWGGTLRDSGAPAGGYIWGGTLRDSGAPAGGYMYMGRDTKGFWSSSWWVYVYGAGH